MEIFAEDGPRGRTGGAKRIVAADELKPRRHRDLRPAEPLSFHSLPVDEFDVRTREEGDFPRIESLGELVPVVGMQ